MHGKLQSGQWELGSKLEPGTFRIQGWLITAVTELLDWYHVLDISLPTVGRVVDVFALLDTILQRKNMYFILRPWPGF
jgi:hypothetical protein